MDFWREKRKGAEKISLVGDQENTFVANSEFVHCYLANKIEYLLAAVSKTNKRGKKDCIKCGKQGEQKKKY